MRMILPYALASAAALAASTSHAQEVVGVLEGRAEITVPEGYEEAGHRGQRDRLKGFATFGAYFSNQIDPNSKKHTGPSSAKNKNVSTQASPLRWFELVEFRLNEKDSFPLPDGEDALPPELEATLKAGIWCPFGSHRKVGLSAVANDPETGLSHCSGMSGAFAYLVCKKFESALVCVSGGNSSEQILAERALGDGRDVDTMTDAQLIKLFHPAGNADVLEQVILSFRYR